MRIAVIDVGSNSTRLYIAEVQGGAVSAQLTRASQVTRLGAGVDSSGRLAAEALKRTHATLAEYHARITAAGVGRAVAVMTSAVRDAANGQEFADAVGARYGFDAHILTGEQEARLTYLGATSESAAGPGGEAAAAGPTLVVDIGGGSTELVMGHGTTLCFHVSTQAGVVRQADRHLSTDPPSDAELEAVSADVRAVLADGVPPCHRRAISRALGVAGTPTVLAAIAQSLEPYDPERVHGYRLTADERDTIFARLKRLPLQERRRVPGLHPDRADVIIPGIVILKEVMDLFRLDAIEVSEHDILRGAALHYA